MDSLHPTERELEILKILWRRGEASVRQVYDEMSQELPIVQNTVQAFLRTMEEKRLVEHRLEGRTFVYRPRVDQEKTSRSLVSRMLHRVFDGALDQLVASAISTKLPTPEEIERLEALLAQLKERQPPAGRPHQPDDDTSTGDAP